MSALEKAEVRLKRVEDEIAHWQGELAKREQAHRDALIQVDSLVLGSQLAPGQARQQVRVLEDAVAEATQVLGLLANQRVDAEQNVKAARIQQRRADAAEFNAQAEALEPALQQAEAEYVRLRRQVEGFRFRAQRERDAAMNEEARLQVTPVETDEHGHTIRRVVRRAV